jgi:hypothetical protein
LGGFDELQGIAKGDSIGDAFSGTGEHTREADLLKTLQAGANPTASFVGNLSGGVLGTLGSGAITGAGKAVATLAPRALAGDALFGSLYGAGEDNDNRLGGAVAGGIAGAVGGALGRGVVRQAGNIIGGSGSGAGRLLYDAGVLQTPGQIGEASGGMFGRFLKRREDRLTGFSGIGDAIGRQQERGLRQFNNAAFREGVGEVPPNIAEDGVQYIEDQIVPQAYGRALDGQNFVADHGFEQAVGRNLDLARGVGGLESEAPYQLQRAVAPFVDEAGNISGHNMQNITQELQRRAARLDRSQASTGPDAAALLRDTSDELGAMVERQAPGVMDQFREANSIYRNGQIIKDAVGRALNTEGVFTPAQLGMAARANAKKYGGNYANPTRPFFDLQRAGQQVLPSKVPDSGTAGRQAAGEGVTGAIRALGRNLRLPLYSDPAISAINALAYSRPEAARVAGDIVRTKARWGGMFGAPALVYVTQ